MPEPIPFQQFLAYLPCIHSTVQAMSIKEVKEVYIGLSPLIKGHPLKATLSPSIPPGSADWSCPVIIVILGCLGNIIGRVEVLGEEQ